MDKDKGFTDEDMAAVSDNPEWTAAEFARAEPFSKAFPELAEALDGGVTVVRTRVGNALSVTLRDDVAAYYESFGEAAEERLNADLRKLAGLRG